MRQRGCASARDVAKGDVQEGEAAAREVRERELRHGEVRKREMRNARDTKSDSALRWKPRAPRLTPYPTP